ncbi:MAG: hypothetical protein Q9169_007626 [Polycauliona sp. 2 TL-2023]
MALVPVTPELKLAQALDEYEKILTADEKIQLRGQGAPDALAAINFTTTIDRECSNRRRRCMGPRLITFLETVQQFSGVVDTFVSSHPEFAALVWGGVKLTLRVANNFASYFDQLSTLLMNLGRQCPRINRLGTLYPSNGLREALCNYYATIIRLCKHIMQFLRKPAINRLLFVSFDQEFGPFENEIRQFGQEIEFEASLASKQAQKQESELQARERSRAGISRRLIVQMRDDLDRRTAEDQILRQKLDRRKLRKSKFQTLDRLSSYDYQRTYRQIRKECIPGTSNWILEDSKFQEWNIGDSKGLWCSGKYISACVAAKMMESTSPNEVTSLFFCRFDDQESLQARTIIGSIARQMVNDVPEDDFPVLSSDTSVVEFLHNTLSHTRRYSIILDGLDECDESQIWEVSDYLRSLVSSERLHINLFWSSRPSVMACLPIDYQINLETTESQDRVASDISDLIHITLEGWLEGDTPRLRISDPTTISVIVRCLEKEAHGMFLWVKLQLLSLRAKKSDEQIIDTLNHLPRDLPETFERMLAHTTESEDVETARKIFRWVAVAKRPLTVQELREALGITPLQDTWNPRCFINDMKEAVASCGDLVYVDEEQETIHFTHNSVQQYLLLEDDATSLNRYHIDLEKADADAGAICITYLNLSIFNRQLVRAPKVSPGTAAVISTVVNNSLPVSANKIALRFLRLRDQPGKSVQRLLEEATGDELTRRDAELQQYSFLVYAQRFWLDHTKIGIVPDSGKIWKLWLKLLEQAHWRDTLSSQPWTVEDLRKFSTNIAQWTAENNHCSLARLLTDSEYGYPQKNLRILVEAAAKRGFTVLVGICLRSKHVPQDVRDISLQAAARVGHLAVVEQSIQMNANVNASIERQGTALQVAVRGGHSAIVERLLQERADVNAAATVEFGYTALQGAAVEGHLAIVERLLQEKADVNAVATIFGYTALQGAATRGHLAIVERLLQEKADVNAAASMEDGRTALQAAAERGYLVVVERLLQENANVNAAAAGYKGRTALQAAAEGGHLEVVNKLLRAKADVDAVGDGHTALHAAAEGGHLAVVEQLLRAKANINGPAISKTGDRRTPLQLAAKEGHLAVVDVLLLEGANVTKAHGMGKTRGSTALQLAKDGGHLAVVERLEAAGAR